MTKSTGKASASKATGSGQFVKRQRASEKSATIIVGFAAADPMPSPGFLAKTRLKKSGGSLVMTVPASARNLLNLAEGQEMAVSVEGNRVVAEPVSLTKPMRVQRPKYTLEELLAGIDPDAPLTDEERAWMDEPPMGREVW